MEQAMNGLHKVNDSPFEVAQGNSYMENVDYCTRLLTEIRAITTVASNPTGDVYSQRVYASCFWVIEHLAEELRALVHTMCHQHYGRDRQSS